MKELNNVELSDSMFFNVKILNHNPLALQVV